MQKQFSGEIIIISSNDAGTYIFFNFDANLTSYAKLNSEWRLKYKTRTLTK